MALNFPSSPTNGQTFLGTGGVVYTYNSSTTAWSASGVGYSGSIGYTGSFGYTGSSAQYLSANALSQNFISNGSNTVYTLTTSVTSQNNILITIDGILQVPSLHYTISGTTLTLGTAAPQYSIIEIRNLESGTGSTITGVTTGKSIAMAIVFGG